MKQIWNFILENWDVIAPIIYEIIVRVIPTKKNLSLIDNGWKILNLVITNRRKPHGNENITSVTGKTKNAVNVRIDKHILSMLFILISFTSLAQVNQFGKGFFSYNVADTAFIQTTRNNYQTTQGNTGVVYFDESRNKWRIWDGTQYVDLINDAVSGIATASNGLNVVGSDVRLGGTLTMDTQITGNDVGFQQDVSESGTGDGFLFAMGRANYLGTNAVEMLSFAAATNNLAPAVRVYPFNAQFGLFDITNNLFRGGYTATTDASDNETYRFTGKHLFTPTTTLAGLNLGLVATDPTTPANGDLWINSTATNALKVRMNNTTEFLLRSSTAPASNEVIFGNSGNTGRVASNSNFTFSTVNNTLTVPRAVHTSTATLPGINIGVVAGNPSTLVDGDMWQNSSISGLNTRIGGQTRTVMLANNPQIISGVPWSVGNNGAFMGFESEFTYNSTTNTLDVDRVTLQPSATLAGLNVGGLAGDPSTPSNGDLWYDQTANELTARINGTNVALGAGGGIGGTATANQIAYGTGANTIGSKSTFTWNPSIDEFTAGTIVMDNNTIYGTGGTNLFLDAIGVEITSLQKHNFTSDANNAGINVGSVAGNPTPLVNGDMWYNSTTSSLNARINGQTVELGSGLMRYSAVIPAATFRSCGTVPISLVISDNTSYFNPVNAILIAGTGVTAYNFSSDVIVNNPGNNCVSCALLSTATTAINNVTNARGIKMFESDVRGGNGSIFQSTSPNPVLVLTTANGSDATTGDRDITIILYYTRN